MVHRLSLLQALAGTVAARRGRHAYLAAASAACRARGCAHAAGVPVDASVSRVQQACCRASPGFRPRRDRLGPTIRVRIVDGVAAADGVPISIFAARTRRQVTRRVDVEFISAVGAAIGFQRTHHCQRGPDWPSAFLLSFFDFLPLLRPTGSLLGTVAAAAAAAGLAALATATTRGVLASLLGGAEARWRSPPPAICSSPSCAAPRTACRP